MKEPGAILGMYLLALVVLQELKYATADLLELPPKCHRLLCGGEIMSSSAAQTVLSQR